jgi:hypothetical protein
MAEPAIPAPIKATGSHFYKYSPFDGQRQNWLKEIIIQHQIYVPNLTQLNDPPDGRPKLAPMTEDELYSFFYGGQFGVLKRNSRMSVEEQVREAAVLDVNLRQHGKDTIMRETARLLYKELDAWRIYSLSKRYDNMGLWAKYAADHTGYCLEFSNAGEFFASAYEVTYGEPVELRIEELAQQNGHWFFRKSRDWSSEEKVRILVRRHSSAVVSIDPSYLTRIILGWKMRDDDRKLIREWSKSRSPELNVVTACYDQFTQSLRLVE